MLEALNSINQIIHSTNNFDKIMKKAISEASKAIGCETGAISFRKDNRWTVQYVHGFPDRVIGSEMNDKEEPHAALAIKTKKPVAIKDAFKDERVNRNHMKKWRVRSVLVVPLITKDEVIGVIFFNYHRSNFAFDDSHIDFATKLASSISLALENSSLFENLEMELTEHKLAEERNKQLLLDIDQQRARLQAIIDSLPIGLWIVDAIGKMVFINDIAHKIWGGIVPCSKSVEDYHSYKAWWTATGELITAEDMPLARAIRGETLIDDVIDFERFDETRGT
jgi:GAF domain-containing protein